MKKILLMLLVICLLCSTVVFAAELIDDTKEFSEGLAAAGVWSGKWEYGFLNKNGNWEIKPQFNFAGSIAVKTKKSVIYKITDF